MTDEANKKGPESTRREFLTATTALAGAALAGLPGPAAAERKRNPKRGGTVRFGTRDDSVGLDTHRNFIYYVSQPLAGTTGGLLDFDAGMNIVPAIATEWEPSNDLKTWTFKLRQGAEFHNGETIDANAVKWNIERILDPKIGHSFNRSALVDVERVTVDDKWIVQVHLKDPSAAFDSNMVYYPVNLIAPGAVDKADTAPAGCGPFKFKSWKRFDICELVRFENFWESDSEGNTLPYLDGLIGRPKKEDRVRLTALRAGELDLIDNVAYADAPSFIKDYGKTYDTFPVPQVGTAMVTFNLRSGPFSAKDNPDAHMLRTAAAHAIDHEGIHEAVFNKQGKVAKGFYSESSPWYGKDIKPWPAFDPDKAKALRKKAKDGDAKLLIIANDSFPYMQQSGELVHAMLKDAGFNVTFEIHPTPVIQDKYNKAAFDIDSTANSYRIDPDGWYSRNILSTAPETKRRIGYVNEKVDQLILAAAVERDKDKRRQMYADVDSIVNQDLPLLYTHFVSIMQAGTKKLKGYKPAFTGPFQYAGGGMRTAWLES
ncbi:peptide/nickel transport system substrate-binding protein [Rhodospirillales bacterium URHD0017]|nr:peptide/nickel transport system substrate-binding protein [Rhodospirillales bacterium URHD0017]